jgi:hypothetical protein
MMVSSAWALLASASRDHASDKHELRSQSITMIMSSVCSLDPISSQSDASIDGTASHENLWHSPFPLLNLISSRVVLTAIARSLRGSRKAFEMIDFAYLYQGICGLAHAHRAGTMAGHLGAAVTAGYFVGEDQGELPDAVFRGIEGELDRVIDELITTAAVRKQGFGGLWHVINHAAAITELDRYGYKRVAQEALPAHHHHIRLWRSLPDVETELGAVVKSEHDPREPRYWEGMLKRDEARLTHRVKTIYGFNCLKRWIDDEAVVHKADDAFRYLMA